MTPKDLSNVYKYVFEMPFNVNSQDSRDRMQCLIYTLTNMGNDLGHAFKEYTRNLPACSISLILSMTEIFYVPFEDYSESLLNELPEKIKNDVKYIRTQLNRFELYDSLQAIKAISLACLLKKKNPAKSDLSEEFIHDAKSIGLDINSEYKLALAFK